MAPEDDGDAAVRSLDAAPTTARLADMLKDIFSGQAGSLLVTFKTERGVQQCTLAVSQQRSDGL